MVVSIVMGVPPVIIHFRLGFYPTKTIQLLGYPHDELETPSHILLDKHHRNWWLLSPACFFSCVPSVLVRGFDMCCKMADQGVPQCPVLLQHE